MQGSRVPSKRKWIFGAQVAILSHVKIPKDLGIAGQTQVHPLVIAARVGRYGREAPASRRSTARRSYVML